MNETSGNVKGKAKPKPVAPDTNSEEPKKKLDVSVMFSELLRRQADKDKDEGEGSSN